MTDVKPEERVYFLRLQVVEYNGCFLKEVKFRNAWSSYEEAEAWMSASVRILEDLMRGAGTSPVKEVSTKVQN